MDRRLRISWVLWLAACTPAETQTASKSDDVPQKVAKAGTPSERSPDARTVVPPSPEPESELAELPTDQPPQRELEGLPEPVDPQEPSEPVAAPEPAEPVEVPVSDPSRSPKAVSWRTVTNTAETVSMLSISRGVLGQGKSGYYDVDANAAFVLRPEINAPNGTILGRWPRNAWVIEERIKKVPGDRMDEEIRQLRLMRLRGERRWVPQMYEGEQRFEDEGQAFVVGTKGGMLAEDGGYIVRVAGNAGDPEVGVGRSGELLAFFETGSGRIYTVRRDGEAAYVQRNCEDTECRDQNAMKLPITKYWQFPMSAARGKHSISVVAKVREDGEDKPMLLHYGGGSWKLERIAAAPAGLWGARDGGLWVNVEGALEYRAPDGLWHSVELPEGATTMTAAVRDDLSELWIATASGEGSTIYATSAVPELPPAAQTP
ncbi:MAG: hypothetical protein ACRBN8_20005 [Nannocystales bacterium]